MTTDVQQTNTQESIEIWNNDKSEKIRKLFAPNLSNQEFQLFWGLGKSLGANPFTGEIWAVKYDKSKPAQIFLGRDFYRKKAQEQPDYDGHVVDAVYANDEFKVESGVPKHNYSLNDRGELLGAYCVVHKADITHPFYVYVELKEYHKGQSTWKEKPATMIKKVAEAQALRGAYQGIFRGTYDESEQWTGGQSQPTERQALDIDVEDVEEVEPETTNGSAPEEPQGQTPDQELLTQANKLGKELYKGKWFTKSKQMSGEISEGAGSLLDLNDDEMGELILWLEELKAEEEGETV